MATYLSPVGNEQQSDANGAPLSGGQIWTYAAGTSTPIATYTSSVGDVSQSNPVVLNSAGLPDSPIWLPSGQAVKLVIQNASGVTQRTVDNVTGINDPAGVTASSEWTIFTGAPTYISATSFSVGGDQTNVLEVNRRVKTANTGGTVYSRISASSYDPGSGLTTVTVANDSGSLDSGLSEVQYGLLSATHPSVPETWVGRQVRAAADSSEARYALEAVNGTMQTASGTAINFTDVPSWARKITVMLSGISTSGTSNLIMQIGDSGGIETSGYLGAASQTANATAVAASNFTTGFGVTAVLSAVSVVHGSMTLTRMDGTTNRWVANGQVAFSDPQTHQSAGSKALTAALDRIRLTTVGGTDTFDAGSVNVLYE